MVDTCSGPTPVHRVGGVTSALTPVLANQRVRLEPLEHRHAADLAEAVAVQDLWRTWYTHIPAPDAVGREIDRRLELQRAGPARASLVYGVTISSWVVAITV